MLTVHVDVETETFESGIMRVLNDTVAMLYPAWVNESANPSYERHLWDCDPFKPTRNKR